MKNRIILMAAAIAAMAVSCQKVEISTPVANTEPMVITAGVETKTSLGADGKTVNWTSDDIIAVFDIDDVKNEFSAKSVSGTSATFAGSVTKGTTQFYAVYPSNLAKSASKGTLSVTIPTDQTSAAGTFAEEHNISVAKGVRPLGDDSQVESVVAFKNVCGLLKFTVPSYVGNVSSVTVSTPNEQALAGNATITYKEGSPVLSIAEDGKKAISMSGSFPAGSTFWFVVAPQTLEGLIVTVKAGDDTYGYNTYVMSTTDGIEIKSGHYKNIGVLKLGTTASAVHTYVDGILTGTTVSVNNIKTDNSGIASYTITNSAGTPVRNSENTITSWPYLPQGTYTVTGLDTNGKSIDPVMFEVPAPEFTVTTPDAYTTYDVAYNGKGEKTGPAAANELNAETIYGLNSNPSVSISPVILENSNYSKIWGSFVTTVDGSSFTLNTKNELTGCAWGSHTISTSYTFDGVTITGTKNVNITGLPYSAKPPKRGEDVSHSWDSNAYIDSQYYSSIKWGSDHVTIISSLSHDLDITSPRFSITSSTPVQVSVSGKLISTGGFWVWAAANLRCSIGDSVFISKDYKGSGFGGSKSTDFNESKTSSFTESDNYLRIYQPKGVSGPEIHVYEVKIKYI